MGCGGGGKSPIPPTPSNDGSGQPSATLTANPTRVRGGDVVTLSLSANPTPISVSWEQVPPQPRGTFTGDRLQAIWTAPSVSSTTEFSLIANIVFPATTLSRSVTVTVEPPGNGGGGNPPPSPPAVSISYPTPDGRTNVVAEGVKLTLLGNVRAGSYPVSKLQVLDADGFLVQEWTVSDGGFRVDLERFGTLGAKAIRIRVLDSQGNYGEIPLEVINNPGLLDQLAKDFLRRYCAAGEPPRLVRFGDLSDGPYARPVQVWLHRGVEPYISLVQEACTFWTRYSGIEFRILRADERPTGDVYIVIEDKFDVDATYAAETIRGSSSSPFKIDFGSITLYRGWWSASDDERKILILAHELGHIVMTRDDNNIGSGHTDDGSVMDGISPRLVLHPYHQTAMRILYSHQPGDSL